MFDIRPTALDKVFSLRTATHVDRRGTFRKIAHSTTLSDAGLSCEFAEVYCSTSRFSVVRGMHFQAPPYQHAKLVWCLEGCVTDVVLDLRSGKDSYGRAITLELNGQARNGIYIPEGCAHGFAVRSEYATLLYLVTSVHAPDADLGIRWDSLDLDWHVEQPLVSDRDKSHPPLKDFVSPFT